MAGRHPAGMKPRDESAHPVVKHAIEQGYLDTSKDYVIPGFDTHEAANEARKSVYRACRHLNVSCSSKEAEDIDQLTDSSYRLRFRIFSKEHGRRHMSEVTGGDPANLPYNPFAKGEAPLVDDHGRRLR